ncbi:UNVERIFIED_CONTAM: Calcineurin B-like protein 8 [Sesamum latifolium]|uniref:Calcineurin B-like protein n=1 Tax=Sesamum latifolium TaxID=2727402 RepID=A0AAW2SPM7_9LAMI
MRSIASCFCLSKAKNPPGFEEHTILASETTFNVNEVEALYILFEQLSSSIVDDGRIHKEEFLLALFNCSSKKNILAERLFELFDLKRNGVIEFGEFVRSLSIFHPDAPEADKIAFTVKEVKTLNELYRKLGSTLVDDGFLNRTFEEADSDKDGKIDIEEWKDLAVRRPTLLRNMTIPYLKDMTTFPSFTMRSERDDEITI